MKRKYKGATWKMEKYIGKITIRLILEKLIMNKKLFRYYAGFSINGASWSIVTERKVPLLINPTHETRICKDF
jgi:hypothetical protein